jgi:putative peptide zinc metalloprotease protein
VELLGAYKGSACCQPPSLVRRADGQVIQMSPLLYQVACRIDGSCDPAAIAALVSADLGRSLDAGQVRYLITAKLLPLGVVAAGDTPSALPKANPLFALKARGTLLPGRTVNLVGAFLCPLFRWPVVVAVAGSMLAVDWWLFAVHGLGSGISQVLRDPVDLLVVLGLSLASAMFHECGHAAGCHYGGFVAPQDLEVDQARAVAAREPCATAVPGRCREPARRSLTSARRFCRLQSSGGDQRCRQARPASR